MQLRLYHISTTAICSSKHCFIFCRMFRCGNDGPEIDADDEIQAAVDGVKDQIEAKLGKSFTSIVAKRGCKQVQLLDKIVDVLFTR